MAPSAHSYSPAAGSEADETICGGEIGDVIDHSNRDLASQPRTQTAQWSPQSRTSLSSIAALFVDIFLGLLSVAFLILDIVAITRQNEPTDSLLGLYIEEIMKWSSTIYTVTFGVLMGRSTKAIGKYAAEYGIRFSKLCVLTNSALIFDPMIMFVHVPFSLFSLMLLVIWACSPIGGQGNLRLLKKHNITSTNIDEIRYQSTGPLGQSAANYDPQLTEDIYVTAFSQSNESLWGPVDNWGNIKIPRLDAFKDHAIEPDNHGWYDVDKLPRVIETWSGLFGLPVIGLSQYANRRLSFTMQFIYTTTDCDQPVMMGAVKARPITIRQSVHGDDATHPDDDARHFQYLGVSLFQPMSSAPRVLHINMTDSTKTYSFNCTVFQQPVETYVQCIYGACRAVRVRNWQNNPFGARQYTVLDTSRFEPLSALTKSCDAALCPSQNILAGKNLYKLRVHPGWDDYELRLNEIDSRLISSRFSVLLNTAISASQSGSTLFGNLPYQNLSEYGVGITPNESFYSFVSSNYKLEITSEDSSERKLYFLERAEEYIDIFYRDQMQYEILTSPLNVTVHSDHEVYNPNYAWCTLAIISSTVLLSFGLASAYCNFMSLTPNVFDPVIGWTYMNPYLPLPLTADGVYPLAAEERLGMLRKQVVRLGRPYDMRPDRMPERGTESEDPKIPTSGLTEIELEQPAGQEMERFSPIVLGTADRVHRIERKATYQTYIRDTGPLGNV